jgi:hypothetical protein
MFPSSTRTFVPISCNSLPMHVRFVGTEITNLRHNARFLLWFADCNLVMTCSGEFARRISSMAL